MTLDEMDAWGSALWERIYWCVEAMHEYNSLDEREEAIFYRGWVEEVAVARYLTYGPPT